MSTAPAAPLAGKLTYRRTEEEREPDKRPLDLALITRLLTYTRPYVWKRNALLLTVFLRALQIPLIGWSIAAVINGPVAMHLKDPAEHPLGNIFLGALGVLGVAAFTQITFHFRQRLALELGEAVIHDLRQAIFVHLQSLPMSFFNTTKIGRIISRVTSDSEALRVGVQDVLFVGLVGLGQMFVAAAIMLYYDWALFAVVAAMSPILWVLNRYFRNRLSQAYRTTQESFSGLTATLAESINGIRVTQGFVREQRNAELFHEQLVSHGANVVRASDLESLLLPSLELNSQFFLAILILLGGYRVLEHAMPLASLITFFFLANIFFSPIQILGNLYNQALTAMAGAERVFRFLDTPPQWTDAPDAVPLPRLRGEIRFDDVTFSYIPSRPVLHGISLHARPGDMVALVGRTGSGKTSIVNLIARFYLPDSGAVTFDGLETRSVADASLRSQLGIVLQNNFLFTGSVRENIRIGHPAADDADVIAALRNLDCFDLIEALPLGLDTQVGERGAQLSLGQRQLVCFARCWLADPRIILLDEATSSIDTLTELRIQRALERLMAERTSFVVAHRLSTIRHANQVLVLEQGRIHERGTHNELLQRGGLYAELVEQFVQGVGAVAKN